MGKPTNKNSMASNPAAMKVTTDPRNVLARDQLQDTNNQYIPEFHIEDDTVCSRCHAFYQNQHWNRDEGRAETMINAGANQIVCPGCKIIEERNPRGIVTLSGDYWPRHRDDILNLVRNEETRGMHTNPLERIIDVREEGDRLIIETTNEKLAQKIARSIDKAHNGSLDYHWPNGNHLVRVYWERSLEKMAA